MGDFTVLFRREYAFGGRPFSRNRSMTRTAVVFLHKKHLNGVPPQRSWNTAPINMRPNDHDSIYRHFRSFFEDKRYDTIINLDKKKKKHYFTYLHDSSIFITSYNNFYCSVIYKHVMKHKYF